MRAEQLPIRSPDDVARVRQAVRSRAQAMGYSVVEQTKLVTAASELARNTLVYGLGGSVEMQELEDGFTQGLQLVFEDQGPGIDDLDQALTDGFTTGGGMGLGLSGSRRLMSEFDIQSTPGAGTRVAVVLWKRAGTRR
ncbi:ATP-binding protein [Gulbenkiania mobilis]|uniref:ATP-binding protein n=1 Tax=Gulbenkiania mobilis TaxID=397457 RepID=UPI0006BBCEFE|nr:ATP-binding protein [Gulbenkiania mobilis]